ncbi:MAG: DUF5668 domain-containing protein [Acidobacteriota bacterium]
MKQKRTESLIFGLILLVIGVLFLIHNLGYRFDVWDIIADYWPLILIVIGIKYLYEGLKKKIL